LRLKNCELLSKGSHRLRTGRLRGSAFVG
jgi:hypothetical protein